MQKTLIAGYGYGKSMSPIINLGDRIYFAKVQKRDLKIGDIAVFYSRKMIIGHRIIRIYPQYVLTKGDNLPFIDGPVKYSRILGKVIKIEGKFGMINFTRFSIKLINYYMLFFSLTTYFVPNIIGIILSKAIRGRKILLKICAD